MGTSRSLNERDTMIDALASQRFEHLKQALAEVSRVAAEVIDVDHVSIWLFAHDQSQIYCIHDTSATSDAFRSHPLSLDVSLRPEYRQALERYSIFRLTDRRELSPRAGDDLAAYLDERNIVALLDSAIVIDGMLNGVLCHEHRHARSWTRADRRRARKLADIAANAILVERRRRSTALGARFRLLVENSVDAIGMASPEGILEYLNPAARQILGLAPDEPVLGVDFFDFLDHYSAERMRESIFPAVRKEGVWTGRIRLVARKDRAFDATTTISVYRGSNGEIEYLSCMIRDLAEQIDAERRIAEVQSRYEASLAESGDTLFRVDGRYLQIYDVDDSLCALLGYESHQLKLLTLHDVSEESSGVLCKRVAQTLLDGHLLCGEQRLRHADGSWVDVEMAMIRVEGSDGPGISVRLRDIRAIMAQRRYMEELAYYDPLTGLANSNLLRERAEAMLASALTDGKRVGFILLQIERWQRIFDTQGYQIAESLLRQAGHRLNVVFAGQDVLLSRVLGGVEIGILFDGEEDEDALVRRAHEAFIQPFRADGDSLRMSVCSGSARAPQHAVNFKDLTKRAGIALRTANARNLTHCTFDPTQAGRIYDEHLIEEDLRNAIGTSQLTLRYQPIRSRENSEHWWAVEALVRWEHPVLGFLPPADFIPLAEESQLIVALDHFVLRQATRQAMMWPGRMNDILLSVNLSAVTLMTGDLNLLLDDVLTSSGLAAERLCLEVTETSVMMDLTRAAASLNAAHKLGVRIALDDFGTGFSSLAYLKELPVDILKIDRDFIRGIGTDHRDERAIHTIVKLGHDLGIKVLAEGVETASQLSWLINHDIDFLQGFHIALPMASDQLIFTPPAPGTW